MTFRSIPFAALASLALFCGCDPYSSTPGASGCGQNTALIGVRDGFLQNLCGCNEPSGTTASPGQTLTCTLPAGTWVVFDFSNTVLAHQIVSTGANSFPASAPKDPSKPGVVLNHAVQFTTAGTYTFQDTFEPSVNGQVIAQ